MRRPSVLLADDHTILAEGLAALLRDHFTLVGVAANGRELLDYARRHSPDVIITDISMPLLNGIDALQMIKKEGIRSRVIILTMHEDVALVVESLKNGADGYLFKRSACPELVDAVHEVFAGRKYLSAKIDADIHTMLSNYSPGTTRSTSPLTGRQREILQLTAEGKSMKEVASLLKISPRTVESHKYSMMQTLGLKSTAELVQYAIRTKVI